jgi:hypothetical protein
MSYIIYQFKQESSGYGTTDSQKHVRRWTDLPTGVIGMTGEGHLSSLQEMPESRHQG